MIIDPALLQDYFIKVIAMRSTMNYVSLALLFTIIACNDSPDENKGEVEKYVPASQELFAEIAHMDSVMFAAFNARDLDKLMSTFDSSLEFYHDLGGVTNYEQNKINFAGAFERNKTTGLRRDLVPGTLEVYPIKDYGAIETGLHRFCHDENGKPDCGTFKFLHIWQKKNGQWKVTRVASYDHK
jgi:uncharacterized protein DUF4440